MRQTEVTSPATSVDEYLDAQAESVKAALVRLRKAIRSAAPEAEEVISYQIPTYKYFGPLVHFAAFPHHLSLYVVNKEIFTLFEKELQGFPISGTTIRFSPQKQIPSTLVKKIVQARKRQNEERKNLLHKVLPV